MLCFPLPPTLTLSPFTSLPPSCAVVGHTSLRARDCQVCCFWIHAAELCEMDRLLGLALKRVCFIGPVGPGCCGLASLKALEDHRQIQSSPGLFDMYIHEHKAHLPHCVSYQEYGFHLGLCVPARFIQVQAGATFVWQEKEGLQQICCEVSGSSAGRRARSAACSLLSLMAGDSFNSGWGAVCTAQFCPH